MKSLRTVIGAVLVAVSLSASAKSQSPLIVGGVEANKGEFPFIVSLQNKMYGHFCGGSLIKENWILTAAHCTRGVTVEKIQIGLHEQGITTDAETLLVARVIAHPNYDENNMDYDYALIQLATPSKFAPIALNETEINVTAGSEIMTTAAGWGVMKESDYAGATKLQKVAVPLVSKEVCAKAYTGFNDVSDRMLCAGFAQGGKDACQGDSGGPLIMSNTDGKPMLVGITSWGKGCARPNAYGVYSKVSAVIPWINESTK